MNFKIAVFLFSKYCKAYSLLGFKHWSSNNDLLMSSVIFVNIYMACRPIIWTKPVLAILNYNQVESRFERKSISSIKIISEAKNIV